MRRAGHAAARVDRCYALADVAQAHADLQGRRTTGALSARYSVFNSATNPYRESAVTASLAMRF